MLTFGHGPDVAPTLVVLLIGDTCLSRDRTNLVVKTTLRSDLTSPCKIFFFTTPFLVHITINAHEHEITELNRIIDVLSLFHPCATGQDGLYLILAPIDHLIAVESVHSDLVVILPTPAVY